MDKFFYEFIRKLGVTFIVIGIIGGFSVFFLLSDFRFAFALTTFLTNSAIGAMLIGIDNITSAIKSNNYLTRELRKDVEEIKKLSRTINEGL